MKTKRMSLPAAAVLFVMAVALLLFSGVGSTRAALSYRSDEIETDMAYKQLSIELTEQGEAVEGSLALTAIKGELVKPGKVYAEDLSVTNTGAIDGYVRVVIDLYWQNTGKLTNYEPGLIDLYIGGKNITEAVPAGWALDKDSSYLNGGEQIVLYSTAPLAAGESVTVCDGIRIDPDVQKIVDLNTDAKYAYDARNASFGVRVQADMVQARNYQQAALSAWGVNLDEKIG